MKSATYLLVGVLVAIAIIAIIKKHFFEVVDYDLPTQGNALRFAIEGYEDAEASEINEDADAEEEVEGFEGEDEEYDEDDEGDVEHMTTAAKAKRNTKKVKAKLRAAAKKAKKAKRAKKAPATATAAPATATAAATVAPATATAAREKFENTSRFQDLTSKWDAYKAGVGPALSDEDRRELLSLLDTQTDAPGEQEDDHEEDLEQFEQMPYQGTEYAMF